MKILDKPDQFIPEHIAHAADQLREWMMKNKVQEVHGLTFAGPGLPIPCIQVTSDERRVTSDEEGKILGMVAHISNAAFTANWPEKVAALRTDNKRLLNALTAVAGMEMFNQHPEPGLGHPDKNGLRLDDHALLCAEPEMLEIFYDPQDRCTVFRVRKQ